MMDEFTLARLEGKEDLSTAFFADSNNTTAIGRTICAMLNSGGGAILCGVADGQVLGVSTSKRKHRNMVQSFREAISPTPVLTGDLETIDGKSVAVIEVPSGNDRPYVYEGAVYIRRSASTKAADAAALRSMVRAGATAERWERRLSPAMQDEDLDRAEVRAMAAHANDSGRFEFKERNSEQGILREISLWTSEGFTQAADVLFSRTPWRRHPQCRVQWVEHKDGKGADTYANHKWLQGPMLRVCRELFELLRTANTVSSVFKGHAVARHDAPAYSEHALREGVVNALVHRDYSSYSGGVRISVYGDRLEIWNFGRLPDGLKAADLKKDHPSILINPDITQTFYLAGMMEGIGRGTQKIVAECRKLGAKPPVWSDSPSGVTLTIFAAEQGQARSDLNERQRALLDHLVAGEEIDVALYRESFARDITDRQARRDLSELVEIGVLMRIGRGPATKFVRTAQANRT